MLVHNINTYISINFCFQQIQFPVVFISERFDTFIHKFQFHHRNLTKFSVTIFQFNFPNHLIP